MKSHNLLENTQEEKTTKRTNEFINNDPLEVEEKKEPRRSKMAKISLKNYLEFLTYLLENKPKSLKKNNFKSRSTILERGNK
jgi:hypothetical protein